MIHNRFHGSLLPMLGGLAVAGLVLTGCGGSTDTAATSTTTAPSTTASQASPSLPNTGDSAPPAAGSSGSELPAGSDTPAASDTAVAPDTSVAPGAESPSTDGPAASAPCPGADDLRLAAEADAISASLTPPIDFGAPTCAGDWAIAQTPQWAIADPSRNVQPASVLFRYSAGAWTPVTLGSAIDCVSQGVPAELAAQLGCGG